MYGYQSEAGRRLEGSLAAAPDPIQDQGSGGAPITVALGEQDDKVPETTREAVARWIAERAQERDADALSWLIQQAAAALLDCYPPGQGRAVLWGLFRRMAGPEGARP